MSIREKQDLKKSCKILRAKKDPSIIEGPLVELANVD